MTLVVLGLDAADYRLAQRWGCENLLLERHAALETEAHSLDVPATIEVWPTIATGLSPAEHGVLLNPTDRPDRSAALTAATWAVQRLPHPLRERIVELKQQNVGTGKPTTSRSHLFNVGAVRNWPGVTPCHNWVRQGELFSAVHDGELSEHDFSQEYLTLLGEEIGWAAGAEASGYPVAGIHIHYLDHMGHLYAKRPEQLREAYETMDSFVGWLRQRVDDLLLVSDHGMQTAETHDDDPGIHSWYAMAATTLNDAPPENVGDVRQWVEHRIDDSRESSRPGSVDAPTDHLRDLGYL